MPDTLNRPVDDYEECDDDAEASQTSLLTYQESFTGGGTTRMEGWLNHITSSYKNNNASNATAAHAPPAAAANAASSAPVSSSATSKLSKTVAKKTMNKCPRYFVLRGSILSFYAQRHDVKAKGTFILTRGCTVGPVIFASLEDVPNSTTTTTEGCTSDDVAGNAAAKSKKKARNLYCVQIAWPIYNKPSRDEQVIAQVKAQVAAESENEALQQKKLKLLQQLELQEMLPLVEENDSLAGSAVGARGGSSALEGGTKSPMLWPKQLIRRVKSENSGSPRQGIRDAKVFQERSLPFLTDGDEDDGDQQECEHDVVFKRRERCSGEQLHPTLLFPSSTFQSPASAAPIVNNSQHRRHITELPPASGNSSSQQLHPEITKYPSPTDHEFGPHRHYKTQIEKQTRDQQKSTEEMQKVQQLLSQEASHQKTRKRMIQGTKVAAVSTAAITAGLLTAGVGLAAGLVFVGVTAAAGGSGAVVGSKVFDRALGKYFYNHSQKSFHLIIGAVTYEEAMRWKRAIEKVIKELVDESNEKPGEMGEEWRVKKGPNGGEESRGGAVAGTVAAFSHSMSSTGTTSRSGSNDVRDNVMHHEIMTPKWVPIQGGGMALWGILGALGGGGDNLRIFREDLPGGGGSSFNPYLLFAALWFFAQPPSSPFPTIPRFRSNVGLAGHPFPPFKASVTLKSNSLDAFMCVMCNGRIHNDDYVNYNGVNGRIPMPNPEQIASFRIIETIDDHMDVIHLVFRPLYLFPFWTAPRDFVMYRFWKYDDDGTYQICLDSRRHRDCPPVPGYVRGDMHSVYTIAPLKWKKSRGAIDAGTYIAAAASASHANRPNLMNEECLLSYVVQVDPRGWVPTTSSVPFFRNQGYGDAFAIMALHQMLDVKEKLNKIRFVSVPIDGSQSTASGRSHWGRSRTKQSTKHPDNGQFGSGEILARGNRRAPPKLERSNSDLFASAAINNGSHREQNNFVSTLYRTDSADITDDDADYDFRNSRVRELFVADVYPQPSLSTNVENDSTFDSSSNKDNPTVLTPINCIPPPTR